MINELVKECYLNSVRHGFWEQSDNIPEKLMLIVSEVAEALEDYRNHEMGHIGEELADCCIRIFDLAGYLVIDLEKEIKTKMEKNRARPHLHGGKRA